MGRWWGYEPPYRATTDFQIGGWHSRKGAAYAGFCVRGFRLHFMHKVVEIGKGLTPRESVPEAGLYYYCARYYDPASGRFLSEDPMGYLGGRNFFVYVGGDVPNLTDPLG